MEREQLSSIDKYNVSAPHRTGMNLKTKIAKLTLEIGDCEKKFPILKRIIQENDDFQKNEHNEREIELVLQFEDQAKINCGILRLLLEECDQIMETKKRLTLESQELVERNKHATLAMSDARNTMSFNFISSCNEFRNRWEREKTEREQMAMELKTQEIRTMTVRGLQPQLQQIITAHQAERIKVESEAEAAKYSIRLVFQRELDDKLAKACSDTEIKKQEAMFEKKKHWGQRIDLLNQQHDQEIFEARKAYRQDLDLQRNLQRQELRTIKESQTNQRTTRRIAFTHGLQEERQRLAEEKNILVNQTNMEIENLVNVESEKNKMWETKLVSQLETEFLGILKEVTGTIEKRRDATIDANIRKLKRDSVQLDYEANAEYQGKVSRTKAVLTESFNHAQNDLENAQKKLAVAKKDYDSFHGHKFQRKSTLDEQIKQIESVKQDILEMKLREQEIAGKSHHVVKELEHEFQEKIDVIESLKHTMKQEIEDALDMKLQKQRSHQETLRRIIADHEMQLLQLEHNVKKDISEVEHMNFVAQQDIHDSDADLHQTLQLIQSYQQKREQ